MTPSESDLVEMLRKMIMIREFDLLAIELRKARRIHGALHPYVGEEAVALLVPHPRLVWCRPERQMRAPLR